MHLKLLLVCTVAATVVNAIGGAPAIIAQLESDLATLKTLCGRSVPAPAVQRAAGGKTGQVALAVTGPTGGAAGGDAGGTVSGALTFGKCPSGPSIEFSPGLDGRKATEFSFRPQNPIAQFSGQATALNPSIIINFLCDRLNDRCQDKVNEQKCRDFKAKVDASGDRSGKVADDFNALFGVKSNFAAVGTAGAATSGAAPVSTAGAATSGAAGGASKFGLCPSGPSIEFAPGLDGRKATEFSFRPQNPIAQFSGQATALNPSIIINFLCDRLNDKCQDKVDEQKCRDFKAKVDASGDRSGKVADDFNALFGVKSNFAAVGAAGAATSGAAPVSTGGAAISGAAGGASKFGLCPSGPSIEFAPGLDSRKATEFSFRPQNPIAQFSGQATALNPSIIVNFLCDRLNDKCQDKVDEQKCRNFKAKIDASGDRSGKVADDFNALFGVKSNFSAVGPK